MLLKNGEAGFDRHQWDVPLSVGLKLSWVCTLSIQLASLIV